MNTKHTGTITESAILHSLLKAGYYVSIPLGENTPYDLIFEKDGKLLRVQCKTGRFKNGSVGFNVGRVFYSKTTGKFERFSAIKDRIDFYGIFCPDNNKCYLIPVALIKVSNFCSLRVNELPNLSTSSKMMAKDFEF